MNLFDQQLNSFPGEQQRAYGQNLAALGGLGAGCALGALGIGVARLSVVDEMQIEVDEWLKDWDE